MEDSNDIIVNYNGGEIRNKTATKITFAPGIERIDDNAFKRCRELTSVAIPDSVTYIGSNAFDGCEKLSIVTIPDSVTYIGVGAFYCCSFVTAIAIPRGVTKIQANTFHYCRSLERIEIPNSVTEIGRGAFGECVSLRRIDIPNGVTRIGERAFGSCNLTSVTIPDSVTDIDDSAFAECTELTSVTIPDSVTYIGVGAFEECTSLRAIAIPQGVIKIQACTFLRCRSLEWIELPTSITEIGVGAFLGCKILRRFDIPNGVTKIGERAFAWSGIEEIAIPDETDIILNGTFNGCESLRTIQLPASVKGIGKCAFQGCHNFERFVLPNGLPALKKLELSGYYNGVHGWAQLLANSPNLEELSLSLIHIMKRQPASEFEPLKDDDIPMILQLVAVCPSLKTLNISGDCFTPELFEKMESQDIPDHLRQVCIARFNPFPPVDEQINGRWLLPATSLLRVLDANPKLGIWTNKFWHDSEDENVRHRLEMNQYGCRGFTVPDSLWPLLIQRPPKLEREGPRREKRIRTGAPNVLFHLLQRHPGVLGHIHARTVVGPCTKQASHKQEGPEQKRQKNEHPLV